MSFLSSTLLTLVLLVTPSVLAQPRLPDCLTASPHLTVSPEPGGAPPRICIRPESSISFVFDSELLAGGVTVREGRRFVDMALSTFLLTVLPPLDAQPGERFLVEARFADGAAPESVTFELVIHPAWAARQVTVSRHARPLRDYQQELKEKDSRLQSCESTLAQVRREGPGPGLAELIATGVMNPDGEGVKARDLTKEIIDAPSNALLATTIVSFRSTPPSKTNPDSALVVRVAVAVQLRNSSAEAWTPGGAALTLIGQEPKEMKPWPRTPVLPHEDSHWLVVETEVPVHEARGTYSLELWDESGRRPVALGNVRFP